MNYQHSLKILLAVIFTGITVNATLNLLADPLDIYRLADVEGFNRDKTKYSSHTRLAKPLQLVEIKPDRIAIGSSRVDYGIPVTGSAWDTRGANGFNSAVSNANINEIRDIFLHAVSVSEIDSAVIGLDFFMFQAPSLHPYDYPSILAPQNNALSREVNRLFFTLFNLDITRASLRTLGEQGRGKQSHRRDGHRLNHIMRKGSVKSGYESLFRKFERNYPRTRWSECAENEFLYHYGRFDTLQMFREILTTARDSGVELKLFISPIHARIQDTIVASELWPAYEKWKWDLLGIVEEFSSAPAAIELWDFSGYNRFTTEAVPADDSGQAMRWYLDPSHYSDELGKLLLDTLYGAPAAGDFGVRLTTAGIDAHLQKVRDAQRAYQDAHAAHFEQVLRETKKILAEKRRSGVSCAIHR